MSGRLQSVREVLAGESREHTLSENADTSRRLILAAIVVGNVIGAAVVVVLLGLILPLPPEARREHSFGGIGGAATVAAAGYVVVALAVGSVVGLRLARPVIDFYRAGRPATETDRRAVLRLPLVLLELQGVLWGVAVLVFGSAALTTSALYGFEVAITTALGGIPTACLAYQSVQRLLRGGISAVLVDAPPRTREVPGVRPRGLFAWALGVVPLGGVLALAGFSTVTDMTRGELARAAAVLCGVAIAVGLLAVMAFARSVADPLQRLRDAFEQVEAGDLDVQVPVFDATEVGYAAAGFNRMAAGLRERERLRDLFGRQVGEDVARQALEQGVTLGGEERRAAALFVDVIGSTGFATDRPPGEVVEALNRFFDAVVAATQEHGGLVNKFIGDAALCVFGAPLTQDDPAGAALAAARDMRARLRGGELDAGIGVAVGTVVAGNVGNAERYEYTVIGDPVNQAARITELAKQREGRVLASGDALAAAGGEEAARWTAVGDVTLRGRDKPTDLVAPVAEQHGDPTVPPAPTR
ncbi:adenylate cyclase [Jatrophihabitans endophyticus]|uniref:Adenylate cyclase n=1 Tax=Jatrophihabitans endophyticus TaxID=1206085 RepID=A0A1M5CAQ4_9ACTN|nr:adenylate/guanylate cyclase domain-containing protein [Jatrophihabitans endophyticus]SHF51667.1 adenylate cyclase [Jatrophihabitans endophyticus]